MSTNPTAMLEKGCCGGVATAEEECDSLYDRWLNDASEEEAMSDDHEPFWLRMIEKMPERDLMGKDVLDFGCNRGGFLRTLYRTRPFRSGLGVDLARDSVAFANAAAGTMPIEYQVVPSLTTLKRSFDLAFSYEVIYLLKDIGEHAREMFRLLRSGGAYYCATGCHTDFPGWDRCRNELLSCSALTPYNYSLNDYRDTFKAAGFEVSACRLQFDGFVRVDQYPEYFPKVDDSLDYFEKHVTIFRCRKP